MAGTVVDTGDVVQKKKKTELSSVLSSGGDIKQINTNKLIKLQFRVCAMMENHGVP